MESEVRNLVTSEIDRLNSLIERFNEWVDNKSIDGVDSISIVEYTDETSLSDLFVLLAELNGVEGSIGGILGTA